MNTSQTTSFLTKPSGDDRVPDTTFAYMNTRRRLRAYDTVIAEFKRSGITQTTLAKRTGLGTDRISKLLSGPGNWTLDTQSMLLFAISGGEPVEGVDHPLEAPPRNDTYPEFLIHHFDRTPKAGTFRMNVERGTTVSANTAELQTA